MKVPKGVLGIAKLKSGSWHVGARFEASNPQQKSSVGPDQVVEPSIPDVVESALDEEFLSE